MASKFSEDAATAALAGDTFANYSNFHSSAISFVHDTQTIHTPKFCLMTEQ